ncbi:MAG: IS66 family insertion sequence element accessory protein TnpB, partial [Proteobacteria bacterium]|nr:IS66 family insertion sequence element accessory protein TnpB [Pseudomonadota bacterium]
LLVKEKLDHDPFESKALFVFVNRKKNAIRMVYWDLTGFAIWGKVLEKDHFKWPRAKEGAKQMVSSRQLKWLLQGADIEKIKTHTPVEFERTF